MIKNVEKIHKTKSEIIENILVFYDNSLVHEK